jgi:hypothetical protein
MAYRWEINALRGLMLVLMTFTHLPTRWSSPLGQPFGFVSAAEGFVMISAYMAGLVYTERERQHGPDEMRSAFVGRALKIWACQVALLAFAFTIVALLGAVSHAGAIDSLLAFYFERPLLALVSGLLLVYNPALLDILPMYVLFMLISPLLLLHGLRNGWLLIMALSVALWLAAQGQFGGWLYAAATDGLKVKVPLEQTGAFDILAWQFLWVLGLWLGSVHSRTPQLVPARFPKPMVIVALLLAVVCMVWRHAVGQAPFPGNEPLNLLFDKWRLGPLRLLDFMALMLLLMHFAPELKSHLPRLRVLETLGAAALPVFCAHLVVVLTVLALLGEATTPRPLWLDTLLVLVTFAVLYGVALLSAAADRRAKALKQRVSERRQRRRAAVTPAPGAAQ